MKLKKFAAMMLAGVMAVSMLAGCSGKGNTNNGGNDGEGEGGTTTSGYSATLGEKAADTLKAAGKDKIFTFTDNADDQKALAAAVAASSDVNDTLLKTWITSNTIDKTTRAADMLDAFEDKAKLNRDSLVDAAAGLGSFLSDNKPLNTVKVGEIWAANGTVDMDVVLEKIFDEYEDEFKDAPKTATIKGTAPQEVDVEYSYTVSVSVVNVPVRSDLEFSGSVNLVAVTLTRTGEMA